MTNYQPRIGSVAYRAFAYLEEHGPTEEHALADAIDCDFHTLKPSVSLALQGDAMRRYKVGEEFRYESLRPAKPALADAPTPQELDAQDVQRIDAASSASATGVRASQAAWPDPFAAVAGQLGYAAPAPIEPEPPEAPAADITDTIEARDRQSPKLLESLSATGENPTAPVPVPSTGRRAADEPRRFEHALWSDGRVSLEIGHVEVTLTPGETRKLFDYLDKMMGVERGAAE